MIKVNLLDSVTERQSSAAVVEEKVANPAARFWVLGAAVCGLLGLVMVFDFFSASASQAKANQELERQQQIAAQMAAVNKEQADLEKKLKDIQSRIEVIKNLRASQQGPVSLLSDINARIPADSDFRLDSIEQKGGELTIEGQSPNEYSVTQFGRSLEFSDGLFVNVGLEAERKQVEIVAADYTPADGPVDLGVKPEVFRFKIKCKYGPNTPPPSQEPQKKGPGGEQVAKK
jgi:Tfp pilus assembly protein PilN